MASPVNKVVMNVAVSAARVFECIEPPNKIKIIRLPAKVTGHNPLLKEGPPRRLQIFMLPQVIGAAGVVRHLLSYRFGKRFECFEFFAAIP